MKSVRVPSFSGPYFPVSDWIRARKTRNTDTFHTVYFTVKLSQIRVFYGLIIYVRKSSNRNKKVYGCVKGAILLRTCYSFDVLIVFTFNSFLSNLNLPLYFIQKLMQKQLDCHKYSEFVHQRPLLNCVTNVLIAFC